LRIVRGVIRGSGEILAGSGFSVVRTSPGYPDHYTVTFNQPFASMPTVTGSVEFPSGYSIRIVVSTNEVLLYTQLPDGTWADTTVHFIAIGPR